MATSQSTVDVILEQASQAGNLSARKMFGEYALYCGGKVVALICDDQLFVKPTAGGKSHAGAIAEGAPYPGAKPHLLVTGDRWDDAEWLAAMIRITASELPEPKPKKPKARKKRG